MLAVVVLAPSACDGRPVAGAPGGGDPFFPGAGNGGYDVRHYSLALRYEERGEHLRGRALVVARAKRSLRRFNLDLRPWMKVARVRVDGRRADFEHEGQELAITPRRPLRAGRRFEVVVRYSGRPKPVVDRDGAIDGWLRTPDGAFVVNEPQGSPGWYPVNDTPSDKATYDIRVTVPGGRTALANGVLLSRTERAGWATWHWAERSPMAPYLATATNGMFETRFRELDGGLAEYNAVDPETRVGRTDPMPDPRRGWERLSMQPEVVDFFSELYGPYPFESVGAIVDWAPEARVLLESQSKPNYWHVPPPVDLVHEIAHQWFGNSVTVSSWPDIWLHEGFARWSEWIYAERHGGVPAQVEHDERCAYAAGRLEFDDLWNPAPAALRGPQELFATPVYDRGAMTLQALRRRVGDAVFLRILRRWYRENRDGNVSTDDFVQLAERVSRSELSEFFSDWLLEPGRPDRC